MGWWRAFKIILLLGLVAAGYFAYRFYDKPSADNEQALGTVERGNLNVKVTVAGGIMPKRRALITAPYNGYIQKLYVKIGDHVHQGAPILSIAQTIGAVEETVFPLRSPLTGEVVQVWRKEGEYVTGTATGSADPTMVRIDDVSKLYVDANVPEVEVGKLKIGMPVLVRAVAVTQHPYKGKIIEITQAAKEQDRWERSRVEFPLTVELIDKDNLLKPGMSAVIDIIVQEAKNVLMLRHEYVLKVGDQYFVTTEGGQRQPVTVGLENEDAFEIKSGVKEGDKIRPVDFLTAGDGAS